MPVLYKFFQNEGGITRHSERVENDITGKLEINSPHEYGFIQNSMLQLKISYVTMKIEDPVCGSYDLVQQNKF